MSQIVTAEIPAKKSDHDAMLAALKDFMDYQRAHPEICEYTKTRFYTTDAPDNPDEEIWMFIDYLDDYQKYMDSLQAAATTDPEVQQHFRRIMGLAVTGFITDRQFWTEAEELRVDF